MFINRNAKDMWPSAGNGVLDIDRGLSIWICRNGNPLGIAFIGKKLIQTQGIIQKLPIFWIIFIYYFIILLFNFFPFVLEAPGPSFSLGGVSEGGTSSLGSFCPWWRRGTSKQQADG